MKPATFADLVYDAKKQANETREASGLRHSRLFWPKIRDSPRVLLRREGREGSLAGYRHRMDEQRFLINGRIFTAHDPALQQALARIYGTPARPKCLCVGQGVEMYVSKFRDFVIKRMPDTGTEHRVLFQNSVERTWPNAISLLRLTL